MIPVNRIKSDRRCKVCMLQLPDNTELRPKVEEMRMEGAGHDQIIAWAQGQGIHLIRPNLVRHFKNHAPYIQKGITLTPEMRKVVTTVTHSSEVTKNIISKVLGHSEEMIDNWWRKSHGEDIEGPVMPITEKFVIGIMDQEMKRAPKTAIDADIEDLTKRAIEGEVVDDSTTTESS